MLKVPGAFNSVGIDQLHAGFKVTYMNLEARTWLVDVQATTALEYFVPVFPVLNFASSGDIHFCSVFLFSFPGGIFLVIIRPVSKSPPQRGARYHELGFVRKRVLVRFCGRLEFCSRGL